MTLKTPELSRRNALKLAGTAAVAASASAGVGAGVAQAAPSVPAVPRGAAGPLWFATSENNAWTQRAVPALSAADSVGLFERDVALDLAKPQQTIAGFGAAFSEKSWDALALLSPADRARAMELLFGQDGCAFSMCRTPMGASDFARQWYSYNETPGDFAMAKFSVANDRQTLIPFMQAAKALNPDLRMWASPWSPPSWMKKGGHYAMAPAWPGAPSNGIKPEQVGAEGTDQFIQEERYFAAYALYFRRYVEEYAKAGIRIDTVMPQNEFNSAQPFPSCCWTPQGLARFLPHLGREMDKLGTKVFFGTLERNNPALFEAVMADPAAAAVVKGIGVQWAGKGTLPHLARRFPNVELWGSEQECGTGTNDWRYARYNWNTMKRYFEHGASAWTYWNIALTAGGMSNWGWAQNSLIVVDPATRAFRVTQDYWLMRHLAAYVRPGARMVPANNFMGFDDQMVFRNPDGSLVLLANNALGSAQKVRYTWNGKMLALELPADSLSTVVLPAAMLA
ncbi:beta-glycosidase [Novosphingobium sp. FSY-8]|uniref:Beta-glycosidase n=1 Tax=Novosphingobium ovatum TaxID=1908523 RepID=A0ABW9XAT9_9SPHN|nr:beta-glycosidase [Novosphingobium ovatum]NBC35648.1 beta-glycosidase [Novosphingobium ovatum]